MPNAAAKGAGAAVEGLKGCANAPVGGLLFAANKFAFGACVAGCGVVAFWPKIGALTPAGLA